jgi:histidine triad (HIT) family protein
MSEDTVFGKIIRGEIPAEMVYEDESFCAFKDINPGAPVHVLVLPKKPIPTVLDASEDDRLLLGGLLLAANNVARKLGLAESGFRYVINCGKDGGQLVMHLHIHLLGGRDLGWPPG